MTFNAINDFAPFLPSTYNLPEEKDRWSEWLGSNLSDISDCVNDKIIGAYTQDTESIIGSKFIYDTTTRVRPAYRFLLRILSYPNNTSLPPIPLPIPFTNQFVISQVWGSASKPPTTIGTGDYFSFYSQGDSRITFTMNDQNVIITTTQDMTAYNGFIICDYIKDGV